MGIFRSILVFTMLTLLKYASKVFYRHDFAFIGPTPQDPWADIRLVAFLNHTSLFEPVFLGAVPARFIWRLAAHGVVPAADKTTASSPITSSPSPASAMTRGSRSSARSIPTPWSSLRPRGG